MAEGIDGIQPFGTHSNFRDVALALLDAEGKRDQTGILRSAFLEPTMHPQFLLDLVQIAVAALAFRTKQTPRSVVETLFAGCPTDDLWRNQIEEWMADQESGISDTPESPWEIS